MHPMLEKYKRSIHYLAINYTLVYRIRKVESVVSSLVDVYMIYAATQFTYSDK